MSEEKYPTAFCVSRNTINQSTIFSRGEGQEEFELLNSSKVL